jgi:hypothetical protein
VWALWFDRCPASVLDSSTFGLIAVAMDSKDGILPVEGGLLDQSAPYNQARRHVLPLIERHKELEMEARRKRK